MCLITLSVCCWIQSFASVLFAWIHNFRYNSILLAKFCVLKYAHNLLLLRCSLKNVLIISHLPHSIRFNWWFFALMCYFAVFFVLFCPVLLCLCAMKWPGSNESSWFWGDFFSSVQWKNPISTQSLGLTFWHEHKLSFNSNVCYETANFKFHREKNSNSLIKRIKWNLFYVTVALVEAACFRT